MKKVLKWNPDSFIINYRAVGLICGKEYNRK